ncbi:response regulator [Anaerovorax odorimutans]|uniref:response regulator n=1 Tax=Anaerovorax odorimutans TaxID=109327 RepID=UPI0004291D64|nr:response regulator [Anaerovorax odorimutans]
MDKNINVIIFDKMTTTKIRIRNIFRVQGFQVSEASSLNQIFSSIVKYKEFSHILIINIESESIEDNLIRNFREKYLDIPIVLLTSIAKRKFFLECISQGASDYILKPFEDYYLKERVLRLLKDNNNTESKESKFKNNITFNFNEYMNSEILKAKKGRYAFSILKTTLIFPENENTKDLNKRYIFKSLKSLFWETDIFIEYDEENFLGYFPFCPTDNTVIIDDKVKKKFEEIKTNNETLKNYDINNIFITFPEDGSEVEILLNKLFPKVV